MPVYGGWYTSLYAPGYHGGYTILLYAPLYTPGYTTVHTLPVYSAPATGAATRGARRGCPGLKPGETPG